MSNITYCGIHFNVECIREQTEEEFIEAPENRQHWKQPGFTISEKARKERLKELYRLVVPNPSRHDWIFKNKQHANPEQPDTSGGQPESGQPDPGKHGSGEPDAFGPDEKDESLSVKLLNTSSGEKTE